MHWDGTPAAWARVGEFYAGLETVALLNKDGTLSVETDGGRVTVRISGWLVRRDDGSIEVYLPEAA